MRRIVMRAKKSRTKLSPAIVSMLGILGPNWYEELEEGIDMLDGIDYEDRRQLQREYDEDLEL